MKIDIKQLPDKEISVTVERVSVNGKEFNLSELISILDDIYYDGKNIREYVTWEYCDKSELEVKELLEELNVIKSHSGGSWKSENFDEFYKEVYKVNEKNHSKNIK